MGYHARMASLPSIRLFPLCVNDTRVGHLRQSNICSPEMAHNFADDSTWWTRCAGMYHWQGVAALVGIFGWKLAHVSACITVIAEILLANGNCSILFFVTTIAILITSEKADNRAVWATFVNAGGWPSDGISFCLGMLAPAFALAGVDTIVHMSEETKHAAVNVPRAIVGSVIINGVCGFAYIIAILYSIVDVEAVLSNGLATGYPIIEVFHQATRSSSAAVAMMCGPIVLFSMAVFGGECSAVQ